MCHDLKGVWTLTNRRIAFGLFEAYTNTQVGVYTKWSKFGNDSKVNYEEIFSAVLTSGVHQSGRSYLRQAISRNNHSFTNQWLASNATQCSVNLLAFESSALEAFYGGQLILINSTDRSKFNSIFIFNFDSSKAASAGKSFHTENDFKNLLFSDFDISIMVAFNCFRFSRKISLRMP